MIALREIPCPVCGSDTIRAKAKPRHVSAKIRRLLPGWEAVRIVQCARCGLYYTRPMPVLGKEDLDALYDAGYFPEPDTWWTAQRDRDARSRLSLLAAYMDRPRPAFLDVGCGHGHVLEKAAGRGWSAHGLEPSSVLAVRARSRLGRRATIHVETLEAGGVPSGFFDAAHADSVLEHIPDVRAAVQTLRRSLKPGGVAYVLVPNEDRLAYAPARALLALRRRWQETPRLSPLYPPYHILGFNRRSLRHLFSENGFRIRHLRVFRGVEPWRKSGDHERMNLKGKLHRRVEALCWSLGGRMGMGAMLEAVVQKA